ncbi:uncharacterized protein LOC143292703 [Babylonia areolata]|uniref:uncharacterized protein LOC143292703 n=1 Tax=Babylonia areolata TaxID=304850 RepID=UPI003FCF9DDA
MEKKTFVTPRRRRRKRNSLEGSHDLASSYDSVDGGSSDENDSQDLTRDQEVAVHTERPKVDNGVASSSSNTAEKPPGWKRAESGVNRVECPMDMEPVSHGSQSGAEKPKEELGSIEEAFCKYLYLAMGKLPSKVQSYLKHNLSIVLFNVENPEFQQQLRMVQLPSPVTRSLHHSAWTEGISTEGNKEFCKYLSIRIEQLHSDKAQAHIRHAMSAVLLSAESLKRDILAEAMIKAQI